MTSTEERVHTEIDSPVGTLTLVASDGVLCGLYMRLQRHRPAEQNFGHRDDEPFDEVRRQLGEYFAAERTRFDLPLAMAGTPFQRTVWAALQEIPYGQTISYGELAELIGRPSAARAVGMANGRNPIGIIVPCHRVIGASGDLTGYGGGIDRKRALLAFEKGGRLAEQSTVLTTGYEGSERADSRAGMIRPARSSDSPGRVPWRRDRPA